MAADERLVEQAQTCPQNMWFDDAVRLAEQLGWEQVRERGSHKIFRHPEGGRIRSEFPRPLNLQRGRDGKAKAFQVRQMIEMAQALGRLPDSRERE